MFDYDKSGNKKEWRCYSSEALNAEGTAYDFEKQSDKYYTRNNELMDLLGRRKYWPGVFLCSEFTSEKKGWKHSFLGRLGGEQNFLLQFKRVFAIVLWK